MAHVLVSKSADHRPLYRQVKIYSRQGIDLDRATLAAWVGKAAYALKPMFTAMIADLKRSTKLFIDETRAPVLDPKAGQTKTRYFWALSGTVGLGSALGRRGPAWRGLHLCARAQRTICRHHFAGLHRHPARNGYAGYNRLIQPDRSGPAIQLAD